MSEPASETSNPGTHVGVLHRTDATKGERVPERIQLNEITFREADVYPVMTTLEEKLEMAAAISALGVGQIQVRTLDAADIVAGVRAAGSDILVQAIVRPYFHKPYSSWQAEMEAAVAAGVDSILVMQGISAGRIRNEPIGAEAVLAGIDEWIRYGMASGVGQVNLGLADCSRADWDYFERVVKTGVDAGAGLVHLADSMGVLRPATMKMLIGRVQSWTDAPLGVHCHNSFGLALANALAALECGVFEVDCGVNGQDPPKGLPAVDELAVTLYALYDRNIGIDFQKLYEVSHLYARLTGVAVPPYKPVVGERAFAKQRELSIRGVVKDAEVFEPYDPELVGNGPRVSLGPSVGPTAVRVQLDELGVQVDDDRIASLTEEVRKASSEKRGLLSNDELLELVGQPA